MVVIDAAPFSHAMIRILGLGVPTLIVNGADVEYLKENMQVRLDADAGRLVLGADAIAEQYRPFHGVTAPSPGQSIRTLDGTVVALRASVRNAAAARLAHRNGAESIGLIRSEFLNLRMPGA